MSWWSSFAAGFTGGAAGSAIAGYVAGLISSKRVARDEERRLGIDPDDGRQPAARHQGGTMQWTEAITVVRERLNALNDYVDRHSVAQDLTELNQEYVPEQLRAQVQEAIDLANRMLNAVTNDTDDV